MNGFVKFRFLIDLRHFLDSPEIAGLRETREIITTCGTEPTVIYRGLTAQEESTVSHLAADIGGRVIPSTRYEPLD